MTRPDPYFPEHGDTRYSVKHYDLELGCRVDGNRIDGRATLTATAHHELGSIEVDLGEFAVTRLTVDGRKPRRFRHHGGRLRIDLSAPVRAGAEFVLAIAYRGSPRPMPGALGAAGWEELTDGIIVAAQPYGAPSWFPCNDRPDDKASYRFTVTAPAGYHVVANGTLVESRRNSGSTTWIYDQPEPMAPYLATVSIGRYAIHPLPSTVPMSVAVPGGRPIDLPTPFRRQPEMLETFSELFGPYPFATYTVVVTEDDLEIPLESQGISVFGANFLGDDWDSERLVAHELAHQWFGNAVTVPGWDDIWLHEGFACYAEWIWSERSGRETADVHARAHHGRLAGLPQDLLLGDPGPVEMFDDRVYKRGALLLHALRLDLGDALFWRVLATWVERYRYATAGTPEFVALAEEVAERPLRDLFTAWLDERPLPALPART